MYLLTQNKCGLSVLNLKRQLEIGYNAAWRMKLKLLQVMKERDDSKPLSGDIQIDDAYWGSERHGGKRGRGASGKTTFVTAVQTSEKGDPAVMSYPMDYSVLGLLRQLEVIMKLLWLAVAQSAPW